MGRYDTQLKNSNQVELPMKLVERYYNYNVVQTLKLIQEPIEGFLDDGELAHVKAICDRQTREVEYKRHIHKDKPFGRSCPKFASPSIVRFLTACPRLL